LPIPLPEAAKIRILFGRHGLLLPDASFMKSERQKSFGLLGLEKRNTKKKKRKHY